MSQSDRADNFADENQIWCLKVLGGRDARVPSLRGADSVALCLIDKDQFNTRYTDALLAQGSGIVQQYEQQLKDWLRRL
jgi:hypothetical protein